MRRTVVLYGRDGCCLCDEAREALLRVRSRRPFELREIDIDTDDKLLLAYLERVPVVTIDGVEAFELSVDEAELEHLLSAPPPSPPSPSEAPAVPASDTPTTISRVQRG